MTLLVAAALTSARPADLRLVHADARLLADTPKGGAARAGLTACAAGLVRATGAASPLCVAAARAARGQAGHGRVAQAMVGAVASVRAGRAADTSLAAGRVICPGKALVVLVAAAIACAPIAGRAAAARRRAEKPLCGAVKAGIASPAAGLILGARPAELALAAALAKALLAAANRLALAAEGEKGHRDDHKARQDGWQNRGRS